MSTSLASPAAVAPPPAVPGRQRRPLIDRLARWVVGVALVALSGWLIVAQEQFRFAEARLTSALLKPFLGDDVFAFRDQFVIRQDDTHYLGLQITVECTTLVLLVPTLVFLAGVLMFLGSARWTRWIVGALVGVVMISVINMIRIGMIAAATLLWDDTGYDWSHLVIGSVFALVGIVVTLIVMLRIIVGRRTRRRR